MLYRKGVCHASYYEITQIKRAGTFSIVILLCTLFLSVSNFIFSFMLQKSIDSALQGKLDTFFKAGSIFLIAAFLQYVVENPIDALRAYFTEEEIVTIKGEAVGTLFIPFNEGNIYIKARRSIDYNNGRCR